MQRGFIEATVPHRDGDSLRLTVRAVSMEGFAAIGSCYLNLAGECESGSIAEFSGGLESYAMPHDGGPAMRGGYLESLEDSTELVTVSLQPFGVGNRGEVSIQIRLAELDWAEDRRSPWVAEATFRLPVDHASLSRWAGQLRGLVDGTVEVARIEAA